MTSQPSAENRMETAVLNAADIASGNLDGFTSYASIDNPSEVVRAVLDAAWTKFDKDDKSTWPPEPEKSKEYFVMLEGELCCCSWTKPTVSGDCWWHSVINDSVTHYVNPEIFKLKEAHK